MLRRILLHHSSLYFIAIPLMGFAMIYAVVPELQKPDAQCPAVLHLTFLNQWSAGRIPFSLLWSLPAALIMLFLPMLTSRFTMFEKGMFLNSILWLLMLPAVMYFSGDLQVTIASLIVLPVYYFIFGMYKSEYPSHLFFNASLIISIASLFYTPTLLMVLLLWMGWLFYNPFKPRAYLLSVTGVLLPYFFVFSYFFIFDGREHFEIPFRFISLSGIIGNTPFLVFMAGLAFMVLLGLIRLASPGAVKKVGLRKNMNFILLAFVFFAAALFITGEYSLLIFVIFPASVIVNYYFVHTIRSWVFLLMFLLFCGFMLYFPFSGDLFN